jgi:hypothetical protein
MRFGNPRQTTQYLGAHPNEARYTDSIATATLESGLRVRVAGASGEQIATDMPPSVGGTGSAPSPGWLFRAALASCDATLIAMRAAAQGVQLSRLVPKRWRFGWRVGGSGSQSCNVMYLRVGFESEKQFLCRVRRALAA